VANLLRRGAGRQRFANMRMSGPLQPRAIGRAQFDKLASLCIQGTPRMSRPAYGVVSFEDMGKLLL